MPTLYQIAFHAGMKIYPISYEHFSAWFDVRQFFNLPVHTRDDYLFTNPCLKSKIRQINKIKQIKRDEIGNRDKSSDKTRELKIMATRKKKSFRRKSKENKYRVLMDWWWNSIFASNFIQFQIEMRVWGAKFGIGKK